MKKLRYVISLICSLAVCALAAGCGQTTEQEDAYQQMALYIQEGFRTYGIEGTYQAYFEEIKEIEDIYCDILLEGENEWWEERISGSYDAETGWYTFEGVYEPIFAENVPEGNPWGHLKEDSDFVTNMRENYVYSAQISKDQDIASDIRYHSESGPVECDFWKVTPSVENTFEPYFLKHYFYTYYDDRMDVYITIEYPQVDLKDDAALEEQINADLREAFFYSYDYNDEESLLNPKEHMYGEIFRDYVVTRQDESYFSVRIFEYNDFRAANHPNEDEKGITINMKTGKVLQLRDVVGEGWTPVSLLNTGAFVGLWPGDDRKKKIDETRVEFFKDYEFWEKKDLESLDSHFYITSDSLGLIGHVSRDCVLMEAAFEELGVEGL